MTEKKDPCPFCGATPHYNLSKLTACQLHGEPIQDHIFVCPHGCARKSGHTKEAALKNWNQRCAALPEPAGDVGELVETLRKGVQYQLDEYADFHYEVIVDVDAANDAMNKAADALTAQAAKLAHMTECFDRSSKLRDADAKLIIDLQAKLAE